jgi:hypothetical protein
MPTSIQLYKNNAESTLNGTLTIGATTINLAAGQGSRFPSPGANEFFYVTLFEKNTGGDQINYEIVKCTARVGDALTVLRDAEGVVVAAGGTSGGWAYPSSVGINPSQIVYVELRWTAYAAGNVLSKTGNLSGLDDLPTSRTNLGLGTMATQAAGAVSISGGTIAGVSMSGVTLSDASATFADDLDPTKKMQFQLSGIGTGLTRTITVPNTDITLPGTNVVNTWSATQTYNVAPALKGSSTGTTSLSSANASATNYTVTLPASNSSLLISGFSHAITGPTAPRTYTLPDSDSTLLSTASGTATKATNLVGGNATTLLGAVHYQSNTDVTTLLAPNTTATKRFLAQTGTGTNGAIPAWAGILDADLPSALTGKTYNALTLTAAAAGFTVAGGTTSKTLTVSNTLTLTATDGSTLAIGAGGTLGNAAYGTLGSTVQAYDANTAKLNVDQAWTGSQRGALVTQNVVSSGFDVTAGNNFSCTPTTGGTLSFINTASGAGQSGFVFFDNSGGYTISLGATYQKMTAADLTKLNTAGKYVISYFVVATVAYCTVSGNLA